MSSSSTTDNKEEKQVLVPLSILTTIGSYMTDSGMIPLNAYGFIWETMSEIVRRDKIPRLPIEVYAHVADFLDRRSLNRLALANKEIQDMCRKKDKIPWPTLKLDVEDEDEFDGIYLSRDGNSIYQYKRAYQILSGWNRRSGKILPHIHTPCLPYSHVRFSNDFQSVAGFESSESGDIFTSIYCYDLPSASYRELTLVPHGHIEDDQTVHNVKIQGETCMVEYKTPLIDHDEHRIVVLFDLKTRDVVRTIGDVDSWGTVLTNDIVLCENPSDTESPPSLMIWSCRKSNDETPYLFQFPLQQEILEVVPHPVLSRLFGIVAEDEGIILADDCSMRSKLHFGILEVEVSESTKCVDGATYHQGGIAIEEDGDEFRWPEVAESKLTWFPCGKYALYISPFIKEGPLILSLNQSTLELKKAEDFEKIPRYAQKVFRLVNAFLEEIRTIGTLSHLQISGDGTCICLSCSNGLTRILDI